MICWLRSLCPVSEYLNAWVCFQALFPDSSFTPMQTLEGNGSGSTNWKSVSHREDFTRVRGLLASIQVQPQMQVFGRVNQQMGAYSICSSLSLSDKKNIAEMITRPIFCAQSLPLEFPLRRSRYQEPTGVLRQCQEMST